MCLYHIKGHNTVMMVNMTVIFSSTIEALKSLKPAWIITNTSLCSNITAIVQRRTPLGLLKIQLHLLDAIKERWDAGYPVWVSNSLYPMPRGIGNIESSYFLQHPPESSLITIGIINSSSVVGVLHQMVELEIIAKRNAKQKMKEKWYVMFMLGYG